MLHRIRVFIAFIRYRIALRMPGNKMLLRETERINAILNEEVNDGR